MSKQIDDNVLHFYQPKKLLGSGAYGHVWKVFDRQTKKCYALKKIYDAFQNSTDAQRTYRQITVLTQLDHPNIIKLYKVIKAKNNKDLYLLFEYMQADLHSLIGSSILQSSHIKFIIYQLLKSLKYLHSAQLLHRDLKPSNILINSECEIKLCDFGLARSLTHQEDQEIVLSQEVATRWYRSPEMLLSSRKYSKPTDVWSVGCIIGEILIGKPMFPGTSTLDQLEKIMAFTGPPSKQSIDSLCSDVAENLVNQLSIRKKSVKDYFKDHDSQLVKLVYRMLQFNPCKRITIEQALQCNILSQFQQSTQEHQLLCHKIIIPGIDDNIKLTMKQYRQIIYKDIERRYPQENNFSRHETTNSGVKKIHSLQNKKNRSININDTIKRQKSLIQNKKSKSKTNQFPKANVPPVQKIKTILAIHPVPYNSTLNKKFIEKQLTKCDSKPKLCKTKSKGQLIKTRSIKQFLQRKNRNLI